MEQRMENELVDEIIKTKEEVQKLERNIRDNQKKIRQMEQSNTWKYSHVLRKLKKLFDKLFARESKQMITRLASENNELRQQLYEANTTLNELKLMNYELNTNEVYEFVRKLKNDGELYSYINTFIDNKNKQLENYKDALTYAARMYMNEETVLKDSLYDKIIDNLPTDEIPEFLIRSGLTDNPIPLKVASFRGSLTMRMRQKQLLGHLPEWKLDDKRQAYKFVEQFGIQIPTINDAEYTVDTIPKREGTVIKPIDGAGARGVYLVHQFNDIIDVKNSIHLNSWDKLNESMKKDLQSHAVEHDSWMIENIIYENEQEKIAARDLKFYCFYGKVGLVLEIIRYPETRQCWWSASMERMVTGKYDESLFHGLGVTEEELKMVQDLSATIPAPFIRIDFLRSENGLVFGEFTPKPGNYDEFDKPTDQLLGDYFLEAEGRLTEDLIHGKKFAAFENFFGKSEKIKI